MDRTKSVAYVYILIQWTMISFLCSWSNAQLQATPLHPVTIERGQGFDAIAVQLKEAGIITNLAWFKLVARFYGYDRNIKAGEYELSPKMSAKEILSILTEGKAVLYSLTIPEGYTIKQIAQLLEQSPIGSADAFYKLATSAETAKAYEIPGNTLEGYLFPDTYHFPKKMPADGIIKKMVDRFHEIFSDTWRQRAKALGFTVHQIVTLASIIEKETGVAEERKLIASVFHNRLKKGMRLESDPTVIYGIQDFDGNLTRKHLNTLTPYNTYRIAGLPPGPIANPGRDAIEAALYPANTAYLYFVSKNDSTHKFSTNLRDHINAVRKYQLGQ